MRVLTVDVEKFDPMKPNDPFTITEGMLVALAYSDSKFNIYYGEIMGKPKKKTVKIKFYVEDDDGQLQCQKNRTELQRRYKLYAEEWF